MRNAYSVGQVNRYIKNMFTQDYLLQKIYVKGEVSNCKYHTSGHIYFSLKDETGTLNCVMFAGHRRGLAFAMKNGDKVIVGGSVDVYERDGRYQMYAKEITLEGAGALYERYLALKQELEDMGYVTTGDLTPTENFYLGKDGITFYYNVYDIAPYVMGPVKITLPYEMMQHLLSDETMALNDVRNP